MTPTRGNVVAILSNSGKANPRAFAEERLGVLASNHKSAGNDAAALRCEITVPEGSHGGGCDHPTPTLITLSRKTAPRPFKPRGTNNQPLPVPTRSVVVEAPDAVTLRQRTVKTTSFGTAGMHCAAVSLLKRTARLSDILRHMGGMSGLSPTFVTVNRNKRSVALDLKKPGALDAMKQLVAGADVFIQNNRPGAAERMGIGEEALRAVNEKLIYVSISGFGESGPFAHKRVYDPIVQGMSGLADIQGGVKGPPGLMRVIVPDKVTALTAAQSITAALLARERSGRGQHLRLSMLDAVIAFMWPEGMAYHTFVAEGLPKPKPVETPAPAEPALAEPAAEPAGEIHAEPEGADENSDPAQTTVAASDENVVTRHPATRAEARVGKLRPRDGGNDA